MPKGLRHALLAVLALMLTCSPAAAQAAPAKLACKAGQVQVKLKPRKGKQARTTCRTLRAPAKATTAPALARAVAPAPAALRKRLPRRLRGRFPAARMARLDRTVRQVATAAAVSRARVAAAGDCAGEPTAADAVERVVDGVRVTASGGGWKGTGGATDGLSTEVRAELGKSGAMTQSATECTSWDTCPDAQGIVHGTYRTSVAITATAAKDGLEATLSTKLEIEADLVGHVGGDGRVKTFDTVARGYGEVRAKAYRDGKLVAYIPASTIRTVVKVAGQDPRALPTGLNPSAEIVARGPRGSQLNGDAKRDLDIASALYVFSDMMVRSGASRALLKAEEHWYDAAACLDVAFDPPSAKVKGGQKLPVGVRVKAKDGAEVAAAYEATPVDGAVGPPTGTTAATVTWTAPSPVDEGVPFPTFKIVAVSNRGRAVGTHMAEAADKGAWWTVTFQGTGEYHRYEPRGLPYPQLWADHAFAWATAYEPLRIPYDDEAPEIGGYWGSRDVTITGSLKGKRLDGGGTLACSGTPDDAEQIGRVDVRKSAGDGYDLALMPFVLLKPVSDAGCGTFPDTLLWAQGAAAAMTADIHISQAELDGNWSIERQVAPTRSLQACDGGEVNGDFDCTHSVQWSGKVRLERTDPPVGME